MHILTVESNLQLDSTYIYSSAAQCKHSPRCSRVKWLSPWRRYAPRRLLPSSFLLWPRLFLSRTALRQEARFAALRNYQDFFFFFFFSSQCEALTLLIYLDHPDRPHARGPVSAASRRGSPPRQSLPCDDGHRCHRASRVRGPLAGCSAAASKHQV